MSGMPSCARTERSTNSTIEWTIDCGCTTTSIRSNGTPNSQCASRTSRPLFMSVAESIVIFAPIRHVGWRRACSTVTAFEGRSGPPAEGTARRRQHEPADLAGRRPRQALEERAVLGVDRQGGARRARGPLASSVRPPSRASPCWRARWCARPGSRRAWARVPPPPPAPRRRRPPETSAARAARPSGPPSSSGRGEGSSRARRSTAARSSRATAAGRWARTSSATRATSEPRAASPPTRNWSGKAAISSRVRRPIDPVAPSTVTVFTWVIAPQCVSGEVEPIIQGRHVEEQGVEPVQHAAVARNEVARVLGARAPLEERLAQVADLADGAQEDADGGRLRDRQPHERRARDRRHDGRDQLRHPAFDRLARRHARRERTTAESPPHEVRRRLAAPRHPEREQRQHSPARQRAEPDGVPEQPRAVADAEERQRHPGPRTLRRRRRAGAPAPRRRSPPGRARAAAARAGPPRRPARRARRAPVPAPRSASTPAPREHAVQLELGADGEQEHDGREQPGRPPERRGRSGPESRRGRSGAAARARAP